METGARSTRPPQRIGPDLLGPKRNEENGPGLLGPKRNEEKKKGRRSLPKPPEYPFGFSSRNPLAFPPETPSSSRKRPLPRPWTSSSIVLPLPGPSAARADLDLFVRDLFARLQIGSIDLKNKALDSLLKLLASDPPKLAPIVAAEGDLPSLVRLLDPSAHSLIRDQAAAAVSLLATASDASHRTVFKEGALGPLLRVLDSGSGEESGEVQFRAAEEDDTEVSTKLREVVGREEIGVGRVGREEIGVGIQRRSGEKRVWCFAKCSAESPENVVSTFSGFDRILFYFFSKRFLNRSAKHLFLTETVFRVFKKCGIVSGSPTKRSLKDSNKKISRMFFSFGCGGGGG